MKKMAKDEMTKRVAFVYESDSLRKAYQSMQILGMHHVPVVRDHKVVGMISDRDVLLWSHPKGADLVVPDKTVAEIMGNRIVTCLAETSIARVADLMLENGVHGVAVVGENRELVGMITSTDLLRLLRDGEWTHEDRIPFVFERPTSLFGMAV